MVKVYNTIVKPIFFKFDPEFVHDVVTRVGMFLGATPFGRAFVSMFCNYRGTDISKTVDGITYRTPFLLSAGFDYNAQLTRILPSVGFGGVEVGSVTARPCAGNPKPRLKRLVRSRSIVVNKGLCNQGIDRIIRRLQSRSRIPHFVIGVSLARTNDAQAISVEDGIEDYCYSLRRLVETGVGDYYTINISCPNAFGGESFTEPGALDQLCTALDAIAFTKPLYVKLPINKSWEECNQLLQVLAVHRVAGIIIGNLNKDYTHARFSDEVPSVYCGGLSGEPCRALSTALIRQAKKSYGTRFTIIGCGGVLSPEDAAEKFAAGADLVQLVSGLIFNGPLFIKKLAAAYAQSKI